MSSVGNPLATSGSIGHVSLTVFRDNLFDVQNNDCDVTRCKGDGQQLPNSGCAYQVTRARFDTISRQAETRRTTSNDNDLFTPIKSRTSEQNIFVVAI